MTWITNIKLVVGLMTLVLTNDATAITFPKEDDLRSIRSLCGAGNIQSVSVKGNVDAALRNWRNVSAGADLEAAKKDLAGFLNEVKSDGNRDKSLQIYADCVQNMVKTFLDAENQKPKPVSSKGVSDSLLRSAYASDAEMKRDGCRQARGDALAQIKSNCKGTLFIINETCFVQSTESPRTYSVSIDAECQSV